ncbi:MAG: hypothetical protein Q8S31_00375 [Alphaproteobacteria bacterium]|nr:hypothetical protein [Alphaproteobacteria bacterium]
MKLNRLNIKFLFLTFFILSAMNSNFAFSAKKSDLEAQRQKIGKHHHHNTNIIPKFTMPCSRINCQKALPYFALMAMAASIGTMYTINGKLQIVENDVPNLRNDLNTYNKFNTTDVISTNNSTISNKVVNEIALYTGPLNKTEELFPQNQTSCSHHNAIDFSTRFVAMDDGHETTTFTNIGRDTNNLPVVYGEDQGNALKQFENSLIDYDLFDDNQMIKDGYVYRIQKNSVLKILKELTSNSAQKTNIDLKIKSGRICDDHVTFEVDVYINNIKSKKPLYIDISSEYDSFSTNNSPFMHTFHCFDNMQGVFYGNKFYKSNYEDSRLILQTAELFDDVTLIFREKAENVIDSTGEYEVLKYDLLIGGLKVTEYEFKRKV